MNFEIQTFFYITASIAFILLSLALIVTVVAVIQAQRAIRRMTARTNTLVDRIGGAMENVFYGWRRAGMVGVLIRILRSIFKR